MFHLGKEGEQVTPEERFATEVGNIANKLKVAIAADMAGEACDAPVRRIKGMPNNGLAPAQEGKFPTVNLYQMAHVPPRLGQTVLVDIGREVNGSRVHPAQVVRVWGEYCINAKVNLDGPDQLWLTSLMHKSQVPSPTSYMQSRPTYWFHEHDEPPLS